LAAGIRHHTTNPTPKKQPVKMEMTLTKLLYGGLILIILSPNFANAQCNTNASICASSSGPFSFSEPGTPVSNCLDFWGSGYAYIILYISESGPLELLIDADVTTGYLDVAIFNIPTGIDPCVAILDDTNQISCNYASNASGCNQTGTSFPCPSTVSSPIVSAGDRLMIVVENWSGLSTEFTLEMAPSPAAQSSKADPTITPIATSLTTLSGSYQMTAVDNGGTWSGTNITSSGLFDPAAAGAGTFTITYTIGVDTCQSTDTYDITVTDTDDGDGVPSDVEATDGTDPNDECSFLTASISLPVTSTADCDGDGVPNNVEDTDGTDPNDDCSFLTASISLPVTSTAVSCADVIAAAVEQLCQITAAVPPNSVPELQDTANNIADTLLAGTDICGTDCDIAGQLNALIAPEPH
jgi:hypothetical protein